MANSDFFLNLKIFAYDIPKNRHRNVKNKTKIYLANVNKIEAGIEMFKKSQERIQGKSIK